MGLFRPSKNANVFKQLFTEILIALWENIAINIPMTGKNRRKIAL